MLKVLNMILKVSKIIKTLLSSVKNYGGIVRQNLTKPWTFIRINNENWIYEAILSKAWTLVIIIGSIIVVGVIIGVLLAGFILVCEYLVYKFWFQKDVHKSATWKQYIEFRANPKDYVIETRGGAIMITDLVEVIDSSSNRLQGILSFIKTRCFSQPGVYKVNLGKWEALIKSLNKYGLIRWILFQGKSIGFVELDAFLLRALLFSGVSFTVPVIGNVQLGIYEFSRAKLLFNILGLLAVITFGTSFVSLSVIRLILNLAGFKTLGSVAGHYASSSSVGLIAVLSVYLVAELIPPQCSNFAEYLEDAGMQNGKIQLPLPELMDKERSVFFYVTPQPNEIEVFQNPAKLSGNEMATEMPTLGSLFKERHFADYVPRQQVKKFGELLEDSDFNSLPSPSEAPRVQRLGEKILEILEEDRPFD
jgi:hypothetical protein